MRTMDSLAIAPPSSLANASFIMSSVRMDASSPCLCKLVRSSVSLPAMNVGGTLVLPAVSSNTPK